MRRRFFYELFYLRHPPWDTGISPPELMAFIDSRTPGRALDLGCGTGTNSITLAQHGWEVVGVDFVRRAVRKARRKAGQANVKIDFRNDDVARLDDLNGSFDLVLDIGCLHSLSNQQKSGYITNLARLLAPKGTFILYGFISSNGSVQDTGLTPDDFALLTRYLRLVQRLDGTDRGDRASVWLTFQR